MPTENVSEFLDHHLKPLMKQGESYIKDTGDFLEKLKRVEGIPKGAILFTADVVGLYPSIPHDGGLEILQKQYDKFKDKMVLTEDIIKMADFVLKNNLFEFDRKFYQQISGTAIGAKFAPPYACIFMDFIETEFLKMQAIKPWLWKRFIDDIFFIWTDSDENLNKLLKDLNEFHPNLRFTYEKSKEKINFLDLVIKLTDGKIVTDLYCKSTDSHQYLHYDSCHAEHIKRSIVFSQTLRLKRICSQTSDLNSHVKELKSWFSKRGYPDRIISEQVNRALRSEENVKERDGKHIKENGVPLQVTYNPNFKNLRILIRKNLQFLYADPETKRVFTPAPFVSFRSVRNLVRSKVYPLERKVGSAKCNGKCCQVCLNINETDTFESFETKQKYKINHHLNCNDKCLIYLLFCKACGLQYVGSTTDKFRLRWNNYKENDRKALRGEEHMQPELFEHFAGDNHNCFLTDCSITLIDKTDGSDPTRREEYWRKVLKTVAPYGLNTLN